MTGTDVIRSYGAILIMFIVGAGFAAIVVGLLRLVGPGAQLVARNRLPGWWRGMTAWARSRSLRIWCPDRRLAVLISAHLQTETGRRLSRLGVSIAQGPWDADVIVVADADAPRLDAERARTPRPTASVVLVDPTDVVEFRDAMVALSAALRWPAEDATS